VSAIGLNIKSEQVMHLEFISEAGERGVKGNTIALLECIPHGLSVPVVNVLGHAQHQIGVHR
jgi:hypothetical protein